MPEERMWHASLVLFGRSGAQNTQVAVNLLGVRVDHYPAQFLSKRHGKGGFARCRWPVDQDDGLVDHGADAVYLGFKNDTNARNFTGLNFDDKSLREGVAGDHGVAVPGGQVVSEGNVGLMQAVKRFEPDKGFRLATYAMWWIKAAIQEYILRSWSLVKMGTTAAQKKLFFNLRRLKGQMQAIEDGDLRPDQVKQIATKLGVTEQDVVDMNRRLEGPDHSLNALLRSEKVQQDVAKILATAARTSRRVGGGESGESRGRASTLRRHHQRDWHSGIRSHGRRRQHRDQCRRQRQDPRRRA